MPRWKQNSLLLDELMGLDRNGDIDTRHMKFWSEKVCKNFLVGCCPIDLLRNTKAEIGACDKIHSLDLRERYNEEKEFGRFDYEMELLDTLRRVVRDCDRVIERARSRLEIHHQADDDDFRKSKEEIAVEESEEIQSLEADIRQKITDCQRLGIEGDVYESFSLFEETEKLKLKLTELRAQAAMLAAQNMERNPESKHSSQQELRACDICGALLNISDSAPRLADHFIGKMHVGYKTIRETLESLEESVRHKRVRIRSRSRSPYKERHVSRSENQAWSRNSARSESQHWGRNSHRDDNAGWSRSSFRRESRDFREPHSYSHDRRDSRSSRYRH